MVTHIATLVGCDCGNPRHPQIVAEGSFSPEQAHSTRKDFPAVCEHCGAPATTDAPVQLCAIDGEEFLLHRACRIDWLADGEVVTPPDSKFAIPADGSVPDFLRRPMPAPYPDSKFRPGTL